ncbi:MAG: isopentenyl-diphosphate Delta-isomerase [Sedimentitalea sp.]
MTNMIPAWVGDTLVPVEKLEVHQRGLRHMAVSVFVVAGNKVLIQRRALSKYHTPGLWANTCCTHPHWDENHEVCAERRLNEELGITGLSMAHRGRVEYRADVGGGLIEHEVVDIYLARADDDLNFTPNPDEVSEAVWIDLDDLAKEAIRNPERFTPWLRIYLDNHHGTIFGKLN